jgi:hypothetical protein
MHGDGTGIDMKNESTIELFMYWNRLRAGRPAPARTEIEPADIRQMLADTFILERDARGQSVFRLAGTRVCAIYGRELKNYSFASLFGPHDLTLVRKLVNSAFDEKIICVIGFEGRSGEGRSCSFEVILLPLDGGKDSARLFGAVIPDEKPFWLGADVILDNNITTVKVVDPDKEYLYLNNRPSMKVPPLAPTSANFTERRGTSRNGTETPPPTGNRRVRHLTIISGGRDKH